MVLQRSQTARTSQSRPSSLDWESRSFADFQTAEVGTSERSVVADDGSCDVSEQMENFERARHEEVKAEFHDVLAVGIRSVSLGLLLTAVTVYGVPFVDLPFDPSVARSFLGVFGMWLVSGGVVLLSTTPTSQVDIDEFCRLHVSHRVLLCLTLAGFHVAQGFLFPPHFVFLAGAAVAARAAVPIFPLQICFSESLIFWLVIDCFGWGSWHAWVAGHDNDQGDKAADAAGTTLESWAMRHLHAFLDFLRGLVIIVKWLQRRQKAGYEVARTVACYSSLYIWLLTAGAQILIFEPTHIALYITHGTASDVLDSLTNIMRGLALTTPSLVVLVIGRSRFFHMSARRFNRNTIRARRDGAFIASLLDAATIMLGQVWWVHLPAEQKDSRYPPSDRRHNWRRGRVTRLGGDDFEVDLPRSRHLPQEKKVLDRASAADTTCAELMEKARAELRVFDWSQFSLEVLTSGQSKGDFDLSREADPDEKIDFFLSHSWHDDGEAKHKVLTAMACDFQQEHGRDPSFWLDKVCIDQRNIRDGLRVLPVNVMACRQVLAIWGATYPKRLWCIWELFTLLAFSPNIEEVVARITVLSLDNLNDGKFGGLAEELQNFDIEHAQCYDPNEERQLRSVINAMGQHRFNERIRALGSACANSLTGAGGQPGMTSTRMSKMVAWVHQKSHKLAGGASTFNRVARAEQLRDAALQEKESSSRSLQRLSGVELCPMEPRASGGEPLTPSVLD